MKFEKGKNYSMPVFFGPSSYMCEEDGRGFKFYQPGIGEFITVTFESNPAQLEALLPDGFTLNAPYVSVMANELNNLGWLAGNSYSLLSVSVPVHFKGQRDDLDGDLVLVMFENHADPIVAGRDGLGYSKIYADIPRFTKYEKTISVSASSWGFRFIKMSADLDQPAPEKETLISLGQKSKGKMGYKYVAETTTDFTETRSYDMSYPVFNPKEWNKPDDYPWEMQTPQTTFCNGSIEFYNPKWKDMPTYYRVGQGLAALDIKRVIGVQHTIYSEPCAYNLAQRME